MSDKTKRYVVSKVTGGQLRLQEGDVYHVREKWEPPIYVFRADAKPVEALQLSEDSVPRIFAFMEQCNLFQSRIHSCEVLNSRGEFHVAITHFSGRKQTATLGDYVAHVDGMLRVFDGPLFEALFERKEDE